MHTNILPLYNTKLDGSDPFEHKRICNCRRISEAKQVTTLPDLNGTVALELLRFDRANIVEVPSQLCETCPKLKSL